MNEESSREKESSIETLKKLLNTGIPFVLRGSLAGEIISQMPSEHKDIDIFIEDKWLRKLKEYLNKENFTILKRKESKIVFHKGRTTIDCHIWKETDSYYIEKEPWGTFYFPKEGIIKNSFENKVVNIFSPELMWITKLGDPRLTAKKRKNLEKLKEFLNKEKLNNINTKFRFEHKKESSKGCVPN